MDLAERAGHWTLARLADLPRDRNRYEVIDGNLIVSPPPPPWHQAVGSVLLGQLMSQCPPEWLAVYESYLDYGGDGRVPDLLVVRRGALRRRGQLAYQPGDVGLVVEIVSPSSRRTDRLAKPAEYAEVGIPLMWRVELEPELVVHPFRLGRVMGRRPSRGQRRHGRRPVGEWRHRPDRSAAGLAAVHDQNARANLGDGALGCGHDLHPKLVSYRDDDSDRRALAG